MAFSLHMEVLHHSIASPWTVNDVKGASAVKGESTGMEGYIISRYHNKFYHFPPTCYGCTWVFATQLELNQHLNDEHGLSGILCENGTDRLYCESTDGFLMQEHSLT